MQTNPPAQGAAPTWPSHSTNTKMFSEELLEGSKAALTRKGNKLGFVVPAGLSPSEKAAMEPQGRDPSSGGERSLGERGEGNPADSRSLPGPAAPSRPRERLPSPAQPLRAQPRPRALPGQPGRETTEEPRGRSWGTRETRPQPWELHWNLR